MTNEADMNGQAPTSPMPLWIAPALRVKKGVDPLGFQTLTQDRLTPVLLPGVLELSQRARYFSFHAFLLDEYRRRRLAANQGALSDFIRLREWELGIAIQRCPRHCGSSPVGQRRLGRIGLSPGPYPRGLSVKSDLGGYGLYYRSPLESFGIIAKAGTMLGDTPIKVDVIRPDSERAARLASTFRSAIENTEYYRRWMWIDEEIPTEVIDEYAAVACLCGLRDRPDERQAIFTAMFAHDSDTSSESRDMVEEEGGDWGVTQRRRSFAHYLTLISANPEVTSDVSAYRNAMWQSPTPRSPEHALIADEWAGLIAKDVWQDAVCAIWADFCTKGLGLTRRLGRGLTWEELQSLVRNGFAAPPLDHSDVLTKDVIKQLESGEITMPSSTGELKLVSDLTIEELRSDAVGLNTASTGILALLELARRASDRSGTGWARTAGVRSAWQPSLLDFLDSLELHFESHPTIAETTWWVITKYVLPIHERIAYSKMPDFTFRFRWEDGLLRFYDNGAERFPLAAIRSAPLASLSHDLLFWDQDDGANAPVVTDAGIRFVAEVFR